MREGRGAKRRKGGGAGIICDMAQNTQDILCQWAACRALHKIGILWGAERAETLLLKKGGAMCRRNMEARAVTAPCRNSEVTERNAKA